MPRPTINLSGRRFGRLVVTGRAGKATGGKVRWSALCDCGTATVVRAEVLKRGETKSCGCLARQINSLIHRKHGHATRGGYSPEYRIWVGMKSRCEVRSDTNYPKYGARGITVCDRWRCSFPDFLADMGQRPSQVHSIDRRDNDGNYEPSNCRWATRLEQARNKRRKRTSTCP